MDLPRAIRKRIQHIKPSRPQAPTEYNLQYKTWPLQPYTYDTFRISKVKKIPKQHKVELIKELVESRPTSSSNSEVESDTGTPRQYGDGNSTSSPPSIYGVAYKNNSLNSALLAKTVKIFNRPSSNSNTRATLKVGRCNSVPQKLADPKNYFHKKMDNLNQLSKINPVATPTKREAWLEGGNKHTNSLKQSGINTPSKISPAKNSIKIGDLFTALHTMNNESEVENSYYDGAPDCLQALPSERSIPIVNDEEIVSLADSIPATPSPKSKRGPRMRCEKHLKKPFSSKDYDETSLKKSYPNLSKTDIQRLKRTYKGLVELGGSKDCHNDAPTPENVTIHMPAVEGHVFENSKRSPSNNVFSTSYNADYRNWFVCKQLDSEPGKYQTINESALPSSQAHSINVSSDELSTSTSPIYDKKENENSPQLCISPVESVKEGQSNQEKQKILSDGDAIVEEEYDQLFRSDGKPKMFHNVSKSDSKVWNISKPSVPIWGDKTAVSLGSGHWNLPFNENDEWNLSVSDTQRGRLAFKIQEKNSSRENEQNKGLNKQSGDATDPFLATYYPDMRTTASYMTEYSQKFHPFPVQHKTHRFK